MALISQCLACEAPGAIKPFPVEYIGDNIEFAPDPALPICGKSLEYIDLFIDEYVGRSQYGDLKGPIRYNYISDELAMEICGGRACAGRGMVYSPSLFHPHELVHAIRQQQGLPLSLIFLEEGIAHAHDASVSPPWPDTFALVDMLDYPEDKLPFRYYDQAGHFMSFVRHRYSWSSAEALVVAATDVDSVADLDDAVASTLGTDLDRLNADYLASYPRCPGIAWTEFIIECNAAPQPWYDAPTGHQVFALDEDLGCDHPDAFGPLGHRMWLTSTLDVGESGSYQLEVPELPGTILEIGSCDTGCDLAAGFVARDTAVDRTIWLEEGLHVIRMSRPLDHPGPVAMRLEGPL